MNMRHPRLPMLGLAMLGLAVLAACAAAGAARAMDACRGGEFSASPLRPLPQPAVIGVTVTDDSAENVGLAAAFTNGMKDAGARVPGDSTATVAMRLSWQVLTPGGGTGQGSGDSGPSLPQGGITREPPRIPTQGVISGRGSLQPGLLVFRAEARDPSDATVYWIGSVQCTLQGSENESLLYQLGQLIGGAVGQRRERVAL